MVSSTLPEAVSSSRSGTS